ncbi:hypothetical protein [Verrucosispora sp. NA02020]|uniref:hypothetical protein n=1 Tax=Verrucosispora sp. NA02020 TaxID=2742132 RepID=UPI003D724F85
MTPSIVGATNGNSSVDVGQRQVEIELVGVADAEAGRQAAELRDYLLDEDPDLVVDQVRSDPRTQDVGALLVLLLATPAAVAVARGVQQWLARRATSEVVFRSKTDQLKVTNLPARRAEVLALQIVALIEGTSGDE